MTGKSWGQVWGELYDRAVRAVKGDAEVRSAPLNDVADKLRAQLPELGVSDEARARALRAVAEPFADGGPGAHLARDSPDAFLRNIYRDQYHTDGSALAQTYARSLTSAPEKFHRIVAAHTREDPLGGIWLGGISLFNFGHPAIPAVKRGNMPRGWPPGSSWDDVGGVYSNEYRAVLVRNSGRPSGSLNLALHEFGHAVDYALGNPSQAPAFTELHRSVLPLIQKLTDPESVSIYAQAGRRGKLELFAEGFAWLYNGEQPKSV